MADVDEVKWETRQVQETSNRTAAGNVKLIAPPRD
jgi:hypothetical protein